LHRLESNNFVEPNMLGTEKQVFSRIYIVADAIEQINDKIRHFKTLLKISNTDNQNMILEWLEPFDTKNYRN
jgi:uncharacterized protein YlbG (UPF0298 family)